MKIINNNMNLKIPKIKNSYPHYVHLYFFYILGSESKKKKFKKTNQRA